MNIRDKIQQASAFFRRLLSSPRSEMNRWQLTVRYGIDLSIHCARALRHDRAAQMAAALTYHTLFSLLPTLVLVLVFLAGFRGLEQYHEDFKEMVVGAALPEPLIEGAPIQTPEPRTTEDGGDGVLDIGKKEPADQPTPPPNATPGDAGKPRPAAGEESYQEFTRARREMREQIQAALDRLGSVSFGSIGVVGLLVFIYGATALLTTIERSFSMIFGVSELRSIRVRLPIHFTVITLGPLLVIAGQVMQQQFLDLLQADVLTAWLAGPLAILSPLLTSWLVLFAIFSLMPNAHVQRHAAAIGSFVSAVLWLLGKEAFGIYVMNTRALGLYGALGLVPLFLFWIYLTWLVVLFGLELTYTIQNMKGRTFKHVKDKSPDQVLLDSTWLIPLATQIAADFGEGRTTNADQAANRLQLPPHTVRRLLRALEEAHLVHRVGEANEQHAYALARPAEGITLAEILDAGDTLMPAAPTGGDRVHPKAWTAAAALRKSTDTTARSRTLADLAANGRS